MMRLVAGLFALGVGIAGWYYLFYSQAAARLGAVEPTAKNQKRRRLRRINGIAMLLLGVGFYAGFFAIDPDQTPRAFVLVWIGVLVLLGISVVLALADLRFTAQLRRKR